jgi:hypothetical protein
MPFKNAIGFFSSAVDIPSIPTGLASIWINDFARLTVNAPPADVQIEWSESKDGITYSVVSTTGLGIALYDNTTWQNNLMYFKVRAKKGVLYSDYSAPITLQTPMVWKVVLTTDTVAGRTLTIALLTIQAGKTVNFAWGDALDDDYTGTGARSHVYAAIGTYYCLITEDVNFITVLRNNSQLTKLQHSLTKLIWPSLLTSFRMYANSITGTIDTSINALTITESELNAMLLDGDWSALTAVRMNKLNTNDITKLPRHNSIFARAIVNCQANNVSTADLDIWLAWLTTHITAHTPIISCTYTLNGAGMGSPTGGALNVDIVTVKALYVLAGFVATFVIN